MTPLAAAALFFAPSAILAVCGLIGCGVSYWRQDRQKQTVLAAFQKAQEAYQDAKVRRDTRDVHSASVALRNAKTAVLRAELRR